MHVFKIDDVIMDDDYQLSPAPKPVVRKYKQHASGEFSVDVVPGTAHCGISTSRGQFRYQVDIEYADGALNENGFLLDNTDFQRYFQELEPVSISCELLARKSVDHFLSALQDRRNHVYSAEVRIYPFGDVYVTAEVIL